jgi:hypothetical protein
MNAPMLSREALAQHWVALSASDSPDLDRLGLLDVHVRSALAEIARAVVDLGGRLAYGGHLEPGGYTTFLIDELDKRYQKEKLIQLCIPWPVHRQMTRSQLREVENTLPGPARITYLDLDGEKTDAHAGRVEGAQPVSDDERIQGLTAMRRYMNRKSLARVLVAGRRSGFTGRLPGLVEEALLALEDGLPLYLVGGFGGVTLDIIRALGPDAGWLPMIEGEEREPPLVEGLRQLGELTARPDWQLPANGLYADENRRLAESHRPGEIAALVGLGLGRLAGLSRG